MSFMQFDATSVAPQEPMEAIPAGVYIAAITESEIVATKSGTGQMLRLTWDVQDGPMKGRKVWDRLNIANQNPKAEEIGQRQLSTLCHAVGVLRITDSQQLHGIPCQIRVTIRKDDSGQYADQNEVKDYRAVEGVQRKAPATPPAAATPKATQSDAQVPETKKFAPPWASNKAA